MRKGPDWAVPLVAIRFMVNTHTLPPVFLVIQFLRCTVHRCDEVIWSITGEAAKLATGVLLEERHIFVLKLHRLLGVVAQALHRVLANPEEVIECNHR